MDNLSCGIEERAETHGRDVENGVNQGGVYKLHRRGFTQGKLARCTQPLCLVNAGLCQTIVAGTLDADLSGLS